MLKLQYFGHLMQRANSLENTLILVKFEGKRKRGQQKMRWLGSITHSMDMNLSKLWEIAESREAWWDTVLGVAESDTTQPLNKSKANPSTGCAVSLRWSLNFLTCKTQTNDSVPVINLLTLRSKFIMFAFSMNMNPGSLHFFSFARWQNVKFCQQTALTDTT